LVLDDLLDQLVKQHRLVVDRHLLVGDLLPQHVVAGLQLVVSLLSAAPRTVRQQYYQADDE
jgi:hypothetical protein